MVVACTVIILIDISKEQVLRYNLKDILKVEDKELTNWPPKFGA